MKLQNGQTILFLGDSITDANRVRPVAQGNIDDMGESYVSLIYAMMFAKYPQLSLNFINAGISGNQTIDLQKRYQEDVLNYNPDWLFILIGVNDVWRHFTRPHNKEIHVSREKYKSILTELVNKAKEKRTNIVLLSPFFIYDNNKEDKMGKMVNEYGDIMKEVSVECEVDFIDIQKEFDDALKYKNHQLMSNDRVHPNKCGHMIIAKSIVDYLEV
jgi:lysophospholipase L1-like esterase